MKKKLLSVLLTVCMLLTLLPTVALAVGEPVEAGTYEELVSAIATVADGGTITLTAAITGDPININAYEKNFSVDKTASSFGYPVLIGSYTTSTNYYYAYGYGAAGVTMTHAKTTVAKVETYTHTPVDENNVAAYVARTDAIASSPAYVCTDLTKTLAYVSGYYTAVHLKADFAGTATTTKGNFTLFPDGHSMTGVISKANNKTTLTQNNDGSYSVSFVYISLTVAQGGETFSYGASEFSDAVDKANSLSDAVTVTQLASVTAEGPTVLNDNVTYVIDSGKTLLLNSDFTINGTLTNNGTIKIGRGASLTAKTGTVGTLSAPASNYSADNTESGENTTYRFAVDTTNSEASLITDGGAPIAYGTFAEACSAATADHADTVVLNKNLTFTANVKIPSKIDCLDLSGHTMTLTNVYMDASDTNLTILDSSPSKTGKITGGNAKNSLLYLFYGGSVNVVSGTLEDTAGNAAIAIMGRNPSVITIGADATVTSTGAGILILKAGSTSSYSNVTVHAYGKLHGDKDAVNVNGGIAGDGKNLLPVINVYPGAELTSSVGAGIYAAGEATWNISGGTIAGKNGIYMKSGTLTVTGGSITGNGAYAEPVYNGNGYSLTGDALIVDSCGYPGGAPHVIISEGVLTSTNAYALRECMTQGTTPAEELTVSGGSFGGASGKLISATLPGFITDGYFTADPSAYLAEGKTAGTSDKTGYIFMVKDAEVANVEVSVGETTTNAVPEGTENKEVLDAVAVTPDTNDTGLKAAGGDEAAKVTENDKAEAAGALEEAGVTIPAETPVTVVIQPKLTVTPKSYDTENKELTLDIKAVCDIIATTDPSNINTTEGAGQNAVVTKSDQPMTVPTGTPVVIKVKIPAAMATETSPGSGTYNSLNIKHVKDDGKVYYYEAAVTEVGGEYYATFTVTHGFSEFTLMAADNRPLDVTYDSNGGSAVVPTRYYITEVGNALPTSTKSGYTFLGWVFAGFPGTHTTLPDLWTGAGDGNGVIATATAQFRANPSGGVSTYILSFETNGGSKLADVSKAYGTTIDLAGYKPTRDGYSFAGWYSDKALTAPVTSVKLTTNTTIYAKWAEQGIFADVAADAYYKDAVDWAVEKEITDGTSATTFSPNTICTRAQAVTFLWRAYGEPAPTSTVCPFTDVKTDAYYYNAVLWAVEKGITEGTSTTTFSPDDTCTRAQIVTFLYRAAGSPAAVHTDVFTDVAEGAYYESAVLWAVKEGVTEGTSATTFSPNADCTRAQIVTFLYRQLGK